MADEARRWLAAFAARRRSEPPDLSSIEAGSWEPAARDAARLVWRRRVLNEALSVAVARRLRETCARLPELGAEIDGALARLEEDEAAHVTLASAVLSRIERARPPEPEPMELLDERAEQTFVRLVLTGLCVCETVSAARFAAVREHTDMPALRACIEVFHRDERTHAELGFVLWPTAFDRLDAAIGREGAVELVAAELRRTLGHLDRVVGLDLERRGGPPPPRPQPPDNPGVVEPVIDAIAFYSAIHAEVLPRLSALGVPAEEAWASRS